MNGFKRICAVIAGAVLFISGGLKLMDPLGASLVVQEYLKFFHLNFLSFASAVIGVVLALFEGVLGAALITGVWRRFCAIASLCLFGVFTIITAVLWIAGASFDCGCFGEALHLEHWQSFVKNIALLILWCIAFAPLGKDYGRPQKVKYASFAIASVSIALFGLYSILSIPMVDFTNLKPGTELSGADGENFDDITAAIYEKNGREGAFTPDCPPDSTWTFVRYQNYGRGFVDDQAPGQPLSFCDAFGNYADSLALGDKVMIISSWNPQALSERRTDTLEKFALSAEKAGFAVLFLVSGTPETVKTSSPSLAAATYFADRRLLMTLNRSNGGVTYVSGGLITAKWPAGSLPDASELGSVWKKDPVEYLMRRSSKGKVRFQGFLLYTFAVMLLL